MLEEITYTSIPTGGIDLDVLIPLGGPLGPLPPPGLVHVSFSKLLHLRKESQKKKKKKLKLKLKLKAAPW